MKCLSKAISKNADEFYDYVNNNIGPTFDRIEIFSEKHPKMIPFINFGLLCGLPVFIMLGIVVRRISKLN